MRFIYITFGTLFFILLLGFALKNVEPVALHYYLGYAWQAPLSLMLLITFFFGIVVGVVACLPSVIRQRRDLLALKRELKTLKPTE
ncbi:MAG: lipopolysaccharide assembly LapA domain-containing protein [Methylophilaceae bacterium]